MAQRKAPDLRNNWKRFRVNDREEADIDRLCKEEHCDLSTLIRQLIYRRIEERKKGVAA